MPLAHILTAGLGLGRNYIEAKREQEEREAMQKILADVLAPREVTPAVAPVPQTLPQIQLPPPQMGVPGPQTPYQMPQDIMGPQMDPRAAMVSQLMAGQPPVQGPMPPGVGPAPQLAQMQPPSYDQMFQGGQPAIPGQEAVMRDPRADEMLRSVLSHPLASRVPRETLQDVVKYVTGVGAAMPSEPAAPKPGEGHFTLGDTRYDAQGNPIVSAPKEKPERANVFRRMPDGSEALINPYTGEQIARWAAGELPAKLAYAKRVYDKFLASAEQVGDEAAMARLAPGEQKVLTGYASRLSELIEIRDTLQGMGYEMTDNDVRTVMSMYIPPNRQLTTFQGRDASGVETTHVALFNPSPDAEHPITSVAGADGKPLTFRKEPQPAADRELTPQQREKRELNTLAFRDILRDGVVKEGSGPMAEIIKVALTSKDRADNMASIWNAIRYYGSLLDINDPEIAAYISLYQQGLNPKDHAAEFERVAGRSRAPGVATPILRTPGGARFTLED